VDNVTVTMHVLPSPSWCCISL